MEDSRPEEIGYGSNGSSGFFSWFYPLDPTNPRPNIFARFQQVFNNPWLINFMVGLLEGSPEVLALLRHNPFPNAPPRYVRTTLYLYHFTDFTTAQPNGAWWQREQRLQYAPVLSLPDQ